MAGGEGTERCGLADAIQPTVHENRWPANNEARQLAITRTFRLSRRECVSRLLSLMAQLVFRAMPVLLIRSVGSAALLPQLVGSPGNLLMGGPADVCRTLAELIQFRCLHIVLPVAAQPLG